MISMQFPKIQSMLLAAALALATWATPASSMAQPLPDDSQDYYLVTLTGNPPTHHCGRLMGTMLHPAVAQIKAACKSFDFKPDDPIYRARYAQSLPADQLPIVALVRHDGGVIFKASGANIPDAETLAQSLTQMAATDAAKHPRSAASNVAGPLRPDGWRMPNLRPNLIPDTVVIQPEINVPAGVTNWLMVVAVLGGLAGLGIVAVVVIAGVYFIFFSS